jgi:methyltransferase family protein
MGTFSVSKRLQANYDAYYNGISEWREIGAAQKARNILELCETIPHESVLEIGAGEGAILSRLSRAKFSRNLCALEISDSAITAIAARHIEGLRDVLKFDGYTMPYDDDQFQLAILSHVLEHAEHERRLLVEAGRVAKYLFIEVPLENTVRLSLDYEPSPVGHINFYTPKTIRRLVQTSGMEIVRNEIRNGSCAEYMYQSRFKGIIKYWTRELLLRSSPFLSTSVFTYHCALLCRKSGDGVVEVNRP